MTVQLTQIIADFSTTLSLKVAVGDTTATLTSATDSDGVALPTGVYGFTIDRKNSSKEYFECTLTGTALTDVKTVTRGTGVATAGFARAHRKGAEVIISDWVALRRILDDVETSYGGTVDASTIAKGIVKMSTAPVSASSPIAVGDNDSRLPVAYAVDSVGTDSYAITPSPAITAYAAGQVFTFKAGTANTGACSLNVSGLGAKTIKKEVSSDLATGDILQNQIVMVEYDGTNMQLVSVVSGIHDATLLTGLVPTASLSQLPSTSGVGNPPTSSSTQTITHGLGRTPKTIQIFGLGRLNVSTINEPDNCSQGVYTSSGNSCIYRSGAGGGGSDVSPTKDTNFAIYSATSNNAAYASGVIGNVGATTFDIVWTNSGNPSAAVYQWIAQ